MATHRVRRRPAALVMAGAAAAMTTALVCGQAANAVTLPQVDTIIGVGGASNPTSDRILDKFEGALRPTDNRTFVPVHYPAELPVDPSVAAGQAPLGQAIADAGNHPVLVVGYSEGSLVAEMYKRSLIADGSPNAGTLQFLFLASPFVPNGGIYARFPELRLPGYVSTGTAAPSPYDEIFVTLEYDPVGDFPAYANPLSLANAAAGMLYVHGDQGPDNVDLEHDPQSVLVVSSPEGGTDTYVLIRAEHLPLLQPMRDLSTALQTTGLTEPVLGAIEPTLRLAIDMGYTDRDYQNADRPTRFSLFTPPERIAETLRDLPDAIAQGADNFVNELPSAPSNSVDQPKPVQQSPESTPKPKPAPEIKKLKPAEPRAALTTAVSRTLPDLKPKADRADRTDGTPKRDTVKPRKAGKDAKAKSDAPSRKGR